MLILTSTIMMFSSLSKVKADVTIVTVLPFSGYVGDSVWIIANTTAEGGSYTVFFDDGNVSSGTALGKLINASFIVPHAVVGLHNITVRADTSEAKANFTVQTKYSIKTNATKPPSQLQENATIGISLDVTGGEADATYSANVTVTTPKNATYWMNASVAANPNPGNYINDTIAYPGTEWKGPSEEPIANTNYTGIYAITWLNGTATLVTETFFIGLTNSSKYHREDVVDIKAVDYYPPYENVTINISGVGVSYSANLNATADSNGVVHANWTVPQNLTIANYTVSITPVPKSKEAVNDTQIFEIPGFKTEMFTRNLAGNVVSGIFITAYDDSANTYHNTTSGSDGLATAMLEKGNHSIKAFFKKVRVGEMSLTISEESQLNFTCQLTSANINVIDRQNVNMPFVFIDLTYNYTTDLDVKENETATDSGSTNVNGTLQLNLLLPNVTYTINASRYGEVFNQNNNTIHDLPAEAYINITILCPSKKLRLQVIDANNQPIADAMLKAQESMGGLDYSNTTDASGIATLECTFGKYMVKVYHGEILLNETTLELFNDYNETLKCQLYGLTVSIKVIDYFGQPISNAKVTLQREGLAPLSSLTQPNGKATFDSVIGGSLQITVYVADQKQPCITSSFFVDGSKTIELRVEKYVVLAGFLVETSQLTTAIIIALTVILLLSVEVYRRRRLKPKTSSS